MTFKLTKKDYNKIASKVGDATYEYYKRKLMKEIRSQKGSDNIGCDDFVSLNVLTMTAIDNSMIQAVKKSFEFSTKHKMDMDKLYSYYIEILRTMIYQDQLKEAKEKMN